MALRQASEWLVANHPSMFSELFAKTNEPDEQIIEPINTDIAIGSTWAAQIAKNFSTTLGGLITFTGPAATFMLAPSLQFKANKACNLVFSNRVNGITRFETEFTITSTTSGISRILSRSGLIALSPLDTLQFFVRTDTANTTLTWQQATAVLKG